MNKRTHQGATAAFSLFLAAAIACSGTAVARSASAPLDTLVEPSSLVRPDPRYAGADIATSRAVLPEITASETQVIRTPKQPPRLDDPMAGAYSYRLARQAALAENAGGVNTNIMAALNASPDHARYQWWSATQSIRSFDSAGIVKMLPASIRALAESPVARGPFVVAAHQAALLLSALFWTVLVVALYLGKWRTIAHDIAATLLKDKRHRPLFILPLLIPVVALLMKPAWLGMLAALSVPLLVITGGRRRTLLLGAWLCVLGLTFPNWPMLREAVPTIDPGSEVTLLEQGCTLTPSATLVDALAGNLTKAVEPERRARLMTALGIQEARRGDFAASTRYFEQARAIEPGSYPANMGLANNLYYTGNLDEASEAYRRVAAANPERGEVPYNLAQVQFKKLFVPEATASLERARQLGYAPSHAQRAPNPRGELSAVVYPGLTTDAMEKACRYEAGNYPPLVTISGWRHLLGTPPLPLYALVGAPLLLALLLTMWRSRRNDPQQCDNCGAPMCRRCVGKHDNTHLCAGCNETAVRSRSELVLATLLRNKSRSEGLAHASRVVILGRVMPGAAHLATGKFWAGWWRLNLVATGLFLALAGWSFDPGAEVSTPGLQLPTETIDATWLPLPAAMWPGLKGAPVAAGLLLLGLVWLVGMFDGPGLRRGIHDRFTLTAKPEKRETAQRFGVGAR